MVFKSTVRFGVESFGSAQRVHFFLFEGAIATIGHKTSTDLFSHKVTIRGHVMNPNIREAATATAAAVGVLKKTIAAAGVVNNIIVYKTVGEAKFLPLLRSRT